MAKKKAKQAPSKSLLKKWHERTAQIADTEGQAINAADVSRVMKTSMKGLCDLVDSMQATDLEAVELLIAEYRECREAC
jgi:ABC-type transporter Mla MlaB component